ncbi:PD-(D/E)XK nuclease-like domain-containing protein [Paraburkholderia adhaesiva]|uniref:PD-(D/E)XK nuclease-like domain-containing protein n=1 Tax=Paraburkholderia adhaesiva TaxID=2883244 RepID=UPI001F33EBE4|nr:PD-(D/E)XK nuclease-like domain-containing protein [Paraburkholderia adhaesiva]
MDIPAHGRLDHLPATEYFSREAFSSSGVKHLLRSAAHYDAWRTAPREPSSEMAFGTVVHALVLEPDRAPPVAIAPECERRSNADKATWNAFEAGLEGRIALKQAEFDRAQRVRDAVQGHPAARELLAGITSEVSLFWEDDEFGIPCKARLDALRGDGGIVDLKTTRNACADEFARSVARYAYHAQAAHYSSGCEHVLDASPRFYAWVAIETEPPFGCACYVAGTDALCAGRDLVVEAARIYARARREGRWRGYPDTLQPLVMPSWALRLPTLAQED